MKEKDPVIYMIQHKTKKLRYFGQTVNFKRRLNEYKNRKNEKSSKYYIMDIINSEGFDNFTFTIVEHCSEEELDDREMYYIKKYNTTNPLFGYNSQKGEKDKRMFKRTRERMSLSHTGLKESGKTKKKKSNPVIAINDNEIIYSDSGKLFADYINQSKDEVSHAIKRKIRISGYFVFYQNPDKRASLLKEGSKNYNDALKIIERSVETIERDYDVKYLHYDD